MTRDAFISSVSSLDARTDRNIKNYFVNTRAIKALQSSLSTSFAVVGLKGTGKTTLYRSLVEDWLSKGTHKTFGLTTESTSFDTYFGKINCLQFEASVRTGMLLFVLRLIDTEIAAFAPENDLPGWAARKNLLKPGGQILDLLKRFQGFSILGAGLNFNGAEKVESFQPLPSVDRTAILDTLRRLGEGGTKLRIVVDDPDRLFTRGTEVDSHLLAGYILGTNWVAEELGFVQFIHVLKSSVYNDLRNIEEIANLPYDYFHHISWSTEELREVVDARLSFAKADRSKLFEDVKTLSVADMARSIRNGPRDLLRYIEIILKSDNEAVVSQASIKEQSAAFKEEARRQMTSVYSNLYEGIEAFTDMMFATVEPLSVPAFLNRFEALRMESKPTGLDYGASWLWRGERALRALLDAGVVDVQSHGRWLRPFERDYVRFDVQSPNARVQRNSVFMQ